MNEKDSKVLYRKWRPAVWDEVKHQDHVVRTLRNAIAKDKVGQAYIFSGPRGTGKTTAARLLAKAVNCQADDSSARPCNECANCLSFNNNEFLDLIEIDAASHTGVDDARELIENVRYSPNIGPYKVYIIDEVHMLSKQAFNALLKTIEEPPKHVIFVLATTELDKVMPTILSRCQRFEFRRFELDGLVGHLQSICAKEGIEAEDDAVLEIAKFSNGGMRDAISLLDQLSNVGEKLTLEVVQNVLGTATEHTILELVDALIAGEAGKAIDLTHQTLDKGANAQSFTRQVVEYLRGVLLYQIDPKRMVDETEDVRAKIKTHAGAISQAQLIEIIRLFNEAMQLTRGSWSPTLSLEVAAAKCVLMLSGQSVEPAVERVPKPEPRQNLAQPTTKAEDKPVSMPVDKPKQGASTVVAQASEPRQPKPTIETPKTVVETKTPSEQPKTANLKREDLRGVWDQLVKAMQQKDRGFAALLRSAKITEVKQNEVLIGFSEILKKKFDQNEHHNELQTLFQQLTKSDVVLRAVVLGEQGDLPSHLNKDGMVAAAKDLGGKLVS